LLLRLLRQESRGRRNHRNGRMQRLILRFMYNCNNTRNTYNTQMILLNKFIFTRFSYKSEPTYRMIDSYDYQIHCSPRPLQYYFSVYLRVKPRDLVQIHYDAHSYVDHTHSVVGIYIKYVYSRLKQPTLINSVSLIKGNRKINCFLDYYGEILAHVEIIETSVIPLKRKV